MKSPRTPDGSDPNQTVVSFPIQYSSEDMTTTSNSPNSPVIDPSSSPTPTHSPPIPSTPVPARTNGYPSYLQWVGGRKQLNGYIGAILLTGMALLLNADFPDYATAVLVSLGITSFSVAAEDAFKKR
ncbi:MAG: hypothetical protein SWY16_21110 [Cyanobacteriota bacterium]|nr:hypothetical protein [Cyanobacteriota bacterium]